MLPILNALSRHLADNKVSSSQKTYGYNRIATSELYLESVRVTLAPIQDILVSQAITCPISLRVSTHYTPNLNAITGTTMHLVTCTRLHIVPSRSSHRSHQLAIRCLYNSEQLFESSQSKASSHPMMRFGMHSIQKSHLTITKLLTSYLLAQGSNLNCSPNPRLDNESKL